MGAPALDGGAALLGRQALLLRSRGRARGAPRPGLPERGQDELPYLGARDLEVARLLARRLAGDDEPPARVEPVAGQPAQPLLGSVRQPFDGLEIDAIGRASCRERG